MGRQIRPARVFQTMAAELQSSGAGPSRAQEPPWFRVLYSNPPAAIVTRPAAVQLREPDPRKKRPKNVYKPQHMVFPEDKLRQIFFKEHPWELARPRMILETQGRDHERADWSTGLKQPGLKLSGESVVHRQLWLMENKNMSQEAAYDAARREFYRLRQEEQIEQRIAREEAMFVGAYFDHSALEIGHELESRQFEAWKVWAGHELEKSKSGTQSFSPAVEDVDPTATSDAGEAAPAKGPTHDLSFEGF